MKESRLCLGSLIAVVVVLGLALAGCAGGGSESSEPEANLQTAVEEPNFEGRLAELGIELPEPSKPVANYVRAVRTGNLVFLSGHGPSKPEGGFVTGKVPTDLTLEEAKEAARLTAVALLASLRGEIGSLNKVRRVVRVFGMVNADPSFTQQSQVINGCSDLLVEVFGERGKHTRAAVGMASLPMGLAVEISMVVEVAE